MGCLLKLQDKLLMKSIINHVVLLDIDNNFLILRFTLLDLSQSVTCTDILYLTLALQIFSLIINL